MKKSNSLFPANKILVLCTISIFLGIVSFFILDNLLYGQYTKLCGILALLTCLFIFSISSGILFFTLYKRSARSVEELSKLTSLDKLTELYNRRYLDPFLESELDIARRENQMISAIMVDVDHFKKINDSYGHIAGDHVLTTFSQIVLKCIRKTDIIARYGGDEFIVILPNTDTDTAKTIAERIRNDVANACIPPVDGTYISSIHCSVGISTYPIHCNNKNSLIKTSDLALYMAKRSGRNCTRVYQEDYVLN